MAKKSIGGIEDQVKSRFDQAQQDLEASSASDALSRLLEVYEQGRAEAALGGEQVAGMRRVDAHLAAVRRSMFLVLAGVQDENDVETSRLEDAVAERQSRIDELEAECATLREQVESYEKKVADLSEKAASVDALRSELSERFDGLLKTFEAETKRHSEEVERLREAESKALGRVRELESELSDAREQVREMVTKANADETRSDGE